MDASEKQAILTLLDEGREALEHFQVSRATTIHSVQSCAVDLRHMLTDHAIVIGPVNCHEMFLLMAVHPARHAKQIHAKNARRIVFLTAPLKTPHPFFQQPNPARGVAEQIERLIETSGMEWTFLRAGMFAGNARHF